ncbi:MAG: hypothetical protein AMJ79_02420 [Phycisphaerae bacterium SM23_30]|nr:MAG: hypothetical protein AMJ79_02420 [Phycisphaerae bacterium SM23_30]
MVKKVTLLVALMALGLIFWQVMEADAQRAGGPQRTGMQRGQVDIAAVIQFLNQQGLKAEAQQLAAMQKDPAQARQMQALAQRYNSVMRDMQRDPAAGKLSVERLKCELAIEKLVPKAKAQDAQARKDLNGEVGKLFDVIIAQQEALTVGEPAQSPGAQQRTGRGAGDQQRRGVGRGMTPEQIAQLKADIALWKKNKAAIVKSRVEELMLPYPGFPWTQTTGFRF